MMKKLKAVFPQVKKEIDKLINTVFDGDRVIPSSAVVAPPKVARKSKPNSKKSFTASQYFESINYDFRTYGIPRKLLIKKPFLPKTLYLVDKNTAKKFAILIKDHVKEKAIIELYPGFGLLTREIAEFGIEHIDLYEPDSDFTSPAGPLLSLVKSNPEKFKLMNYNFTHVWRIYFDEGYTTDLLRNRVAQKWEGEIFATIVGCLGDLQLIDVLIRSLVHRMELLEFGRFKLIVAIYPSMWSHLTATPEIRSIYRWRSVFFQLLFDYELLGELDRKSFLPWMTKVHTKFPLFRHLREQNETFLCVVRLEPKADFVPSILEEKHLVPFWHFVHHMLANRKLRIIPELEKWIPGCGVSLILMNNGIDIFTEIGELKPHEILGVFKEFISCPEYDRDVFLEQFCANYAKNVEAEEQ